MTTNDLGHTGEGYSPQTAIDSVPITVLATIDPPTHVLPETFSVIEDTPTAFTASVVDPDGEDIISVDLEVSSGKLHLNSGKGLTGFLGTACFLSFSGKKSDVNFVMQGMIYEPTANVSGNYTFTMTYHDMDFAAQHISIPLQITPINDQPNVYVSTSAMTIDEDTPITLSMVVSDIEAGENDIQTFLNSDHCLFNINQTTGLTVSPSNMAQSLTLTGSIDSINTALNVLHVTPTKNYYGNTFVSIKIDDQGYTPLPAESAQKTNLPQITSANHFSISENTAIGTKVHTISATDADHLNLIYQIDAIVPAESFAISQHTGEIWITRHLDHETIQNYTMTVSISDPLTSVTQTVFATITDLNDAPILSNK